MMIGKTAWLLLLVVAVVNAKATDAERKFNDACHYAAGSTAGIIQSPGYPAPYYNNVECVYKFEESSGYCGISVNFLSFSLEDSPGCTSDFLKMGNKAYCGTQLDKKKNMVYKLPLVMNFSSDNMNTGAGFQARYTYVSDCYSACIETFKRSIGQIVAPYPYRTDAFITYEIEKQDDALCLEVNFKYFSLKDDAEYVQIGGVKYDKTSTPATVKVRFPEDGGPVKIDFNTASRAQDKTEFILKYTQTRSGCSTCQYAAGSTTGSIQSPGFPAPYDNNVHCEYKFEERSGYCGLSVNFGSFSLEESPGCTSDFLKMGSKAYCGKELAGKKNMVYTFPFVMNFSSDNMNTGAGFQARYTYTQNCDTACVVELKKTVGYIVPQLDESLKIPKDSLIAYQIEKKAEAKCVKIYIDVLNLKDTGSYLKFGGTNYTEKPAAKTPGDDGIELLFPEDDGPVTVDFVSTKALDPKDKFTLRYKQFTGQGDCKEVRQCQPPFGKTSGILRSPKSPQRYPKNYVCDYVINAVGDMTNVHVDLLSPLADGDTLKYKNEDLKPGEEKDIKFDAENKATLNFKSDGKAETTFNIIVYLTKTP